MNNYWTDVKLTSSSRVSLEDDEVELLTCEDCTIYHDDEKVYRHGNMTITTHRIIYHIHYNHVKDHSISLHLSRIKDISMTLNVFRADKLLLYLLKIPIVNTIPPPGYIRVHFNKSGINEFYNAIKQSLNRKLWETKRKLSKPKQFSTTSAGIGGIISNLHKKIRDNETTVSSSFNDLDALMSNARELVTLAERCAKKLQEQKDNNDNNDNEKNEFNNMLATVGISSPVTRVSAGSTYHVELAKQLSDFSVPLLSRVGGMMTCTDLYCVFNRARGTEMISPDDLIKAGMACDSLNLPIRLHKFDSGVIVIQYSSFDETNMINNIVNIINNNDEYDYLTISNVSEILDISMSISKEHLLEGERRCILVRDETISGICFYVKPLYW